MSGGGQGRGEGERGGEGEGERGEGGGCTERMCIGREICLPFFLDPPEKSQAPIFLTTPHNRQLIDKTV